MLAGPKLKLLNELAAQLNHDELIWANEFLSAKIKTLGDSPEPVPARHSNKKITIAYGTETGNAKKLAVDFAAKAKKKGVHAKLVSLDQYRFNDLSKEEYFVTVISTQGEGEPPIAAQKFYDHLHNNGFKVPAMKYAVLALGDTSYPMFCKTGEDVDIQLEQLGAERFYPLEKCDLDYEQQADTWFDQLLISIDSIPGTKPEPVAPTLTPDTLKKSPGKKIYNGTVLANINLNAAGSAKKTFHIELAVNKIDYLPGDSIGIIPGNDPLIVQEIIARSRIDGDQMVKFKSEEKCMSELLQTRINISFLLEKFVQQYGVLAGQVIPAQRKDLVDLLRNYPIKDAGAFTAFLLTLHPIAPRIYNIASSISAHGNEVHIIALKDEFEVDDKSRVGLCSVFLEDKKEGDTIDFFIQPNKRFRLPAAERDIIMIGPGTGVAPFRSFIAERDVNGATGRNWLFFAEDKFTTDFYYQTEWQNWFGTGVLTNINVAFREDGEALVDIEDKLFQQSAQLFDWIRGGAFVYLCGEKEPMSRVVESALLAIIETEGRFSKEEAIQYFEQLKTGGRYVKDVY